MVCALFVTWLGPFVCYVNLLKDFKFEYEKEFV